jgi:hypothetical protein
LAAAEKAKVIAAAKAAGKKAIEAKVLAMRNKGAADAKAGKYAPPPPAPAPDFDTMNYREGWKSTGIPLPTESAGGGAASKTPLLVGGAVAAVAALILLRR